MPEYNPQQGFDQEAFTDFIVGNGVVGFFDEPIELSSGRESQWYVDWREIGDVYRLETLGEYVVSFAAEQGLEPDCFYGVPEGATRIGHEAQRIYAQNSSDYGPRSHQLPMGRGKAKMHGKPEDRLFVGDKPRGETVVVEDVVTTGGSLLEEIEKLEESDVNVEAAIVLTDRGAVRDDGHQPGDIVEAGGVEYYPMSTAFNVLPRAAEAEDPGDELLAAVEQEFQEHGAQPLPLR